MRKADGMHPDDHLGAVESDVPVASTEGEVLHDQCEVCGQWTDALRETPIDEMLVCPECFAEIPDADPRPGDD